MIPKFVGMTLAQAAQAASANGLNLIQVTSPYMSIDAGLHPDSLVTSQDIPAQPSSPYTTVAITVARRVPGVGSYVQNTPCTVIAPNGNTGYVDTTLTVDTTLYTVDSV